MKYRFKTIDTSTLKGLREAEALKLQGFYMTVIGIDKVQFSIPNNKKVINRRLQ
jgi:hypothetical protein